MSELKLRRLTEHNQRLREDLARPRVRVSEASQRCVLVAELVQAPMLKCHTA
jgi:guanine nucleotide-binding protein subunit gamma